MAPVKAVIDQFEHALAEAHALVREGRGEDACQLLYQARDSAISNGELTEACLFASIRGSYLAAMSKNEEALEAYLDAERLSGNTADRQVATCRHLIYGMSRYSEACTKATEISTSWPDNPGVQHECQAIRGLGLLFLGQSATAVDCFRQLVSDFPSARLAALSCDLTLVEELLTRGVGFEICRSYLGLVEAVARDAREERVLKKILALRELATA